MGGKSEKCSGSLFRVCVPANQTRHASRSRNEQEEEGKECTYSPVMHVPVVSRDEYCKCEECNDTRIVLE